MRALRPEDRAARQRHGWHAEIERGYGSTTVTRAMGDDEVEQWYAHWELAADEPNRIHWVLDLEGEAVGAAFLHVDAHVGQAGGAVVRRHQFASHLLGQPQLPVEPVVHAVAVQAVARQHDIAAVAHRAPGRRAPGRRARRRFRAGAASRRPRLAAAAASGTRCTPHPDARPRCRGAGRHALGRKRACRRWGCRVRRDMPPGISGHRSSTRSRAVPPAPFRARPARSCRPTPSPRSSALRPAPTRTAVSAPAPGWAWCRCAAASRCGKRRPGNAPGCRLANRRR